MKLRRRDVYAWDVFDTDGKQRGRVVKAVDGDWLVSLVIYRDTCRGQEMALMPLSGRYRTRKAAVDFVLDKP